MSKALDLKKLNLKVAEAQLEEYVGRQMFEEAGKLKVNIEKMRKEISNITESEINLLNYTEVNSGDALADTTQPKEEDLPRQIDLGGLDPQQAQQLGIDLSNVIPMKPGFENFVESYREELDETCSEIINEIGQLNSRIIKLNRDIKASPYKGNEGKYLLTKQEIGVLLRPMNEIINIITGGAHMIEALGTLSDISTLNRATVVGQALCNCFVKQEQAYKIARKLVEELPGDVYYSQEVIDENSRSDEEGEDFPG